LARAGPAGTCPVRTWMKSCFPLRIASVSSGCSDTVGAAAYATFRKFGRTTSYQLMIAKTVCSSLLPC
jgi:hypothetical protein